VIVNLPRVRPAASSLAVLCALALGACGNTIQSRPISHSVLESMLVAPHPVYWLGGSFQGMSISEATHDPSGSFSVQYGNCLEGGQGICLPPLRVVTSPDNSFLPGGTAPSAADSIRGVPAVLAEGGRTVVLPTAGVVVDIYGSSARLAAAAARAVVPINAVAVPEGALPAPLPNTGFGSTPLPSQMPSPLRAVAHPSRDRS
jgi:hypothetical protein